VDYDVFAIRRPSGNISYSFVLHDREINPIKIKKYRSPRELGKAIASMDDALADDGLKPWVNQRETFPDEPLFEIEYNRLSQQEMDELRQGIVEEFET